MKLSKKLLSLLLCAVMVLGSVAIGGEEFAQMLDVFSVKASAASSGTCGDNVRWNLSDDGVLTISDTGAMKNYYDLSSVPWYSSLSSIKTVVIENGVTSIGSYAFDYCTGLTSVTIPDSVTSIGGFAFSCCTGLTSITIPNSVKSIGDDAFSCCTGLTSVTIPDSVISIGNGAFSDCSGLTSVTIPNSVTSINAFSFMDCAKLEKIEIPNGVKYIEHDAFSGCINLKEIDLPASVKSIGGDAFSACKNLTRIVISEGITSIGGFAFTDCSSLSSITIPDSVTSIGDYAFYKCTGLTSITIGNSVTSIGSFAFDYCTGLTSIHIPSSVLSIGQYNFETCDNLKYICSDKEICYAKTYAEENCIEFRVCSGHDGSEEPIVKTDETGVSVSYDAAAFDENVDLFVKKCDTAFIQENSSTFSLYGGRMPIDVYQIYMRSTNNTSQKVQPKKEVTVTIPFTKTVSLIAHYINNNPIPEFVNDYKIINGNIQFNISSFSYFAIYEASSADDELNNAKASAISELDTAMKNAKTDEAKKALENGKTAVNAAASVEAVNKAKSDAITAANNADKAYAEKKKFDKVNIKIGSHDPIDYRSKVIITATADNVPDGYKLAIYLGSQKVAEGDNKSVSYEYGELKSDLNYSVKVIDANGKVQKDSSGNDLSKDGGKITCKAGFFQKLIAFFRGLFKALPKIEVKP